MVNRYRVLADAELKDALPRLDDHAVRRRGSGQDRNCGNRQGRKGERKAEGHVCDPQE